MTAIAGCVGEPNGDYEPACASMLEAQRAYGPFHQRPKSWAGSSFGIALNETVPTGLLNAQPLVGGDRYFLVADVRLDNRDQLRRDLGHSHDGPLPPSDAIILLDAWMCWGEACLDRLRGDYAFAVFDSRNRTLSLARDPTGQRPLFFAQANGVAAFASMPSALLASGVVATAFRFERLASMLIGTPNSSDHTYFEEVRRVQPGHLVVVSEASASTTSYWKPPSGDLRLSDDDYVEAYRERLEQAVRPRLERSAGLLGAHLSSGYDSNAVAAEAARLSQDSRPVAFTSAPRLGFDGPRSAWPGCRRVRPGGVGCGKIRNAPRRGPADRSSAVQPPPPRTALPGARPQHHQHGMVDRHFERGSRARGVGHADRPDGQPYDQRWRAFDLGRMGPRRRMGPVVARSQRRRPPARRPLAWRHAQFI